MCAEPLPAGVASIVFGFTPQVFFNVDSRDAVEHMETWSRYTESKMKNRLKISTVSFKPFAEVEKSLAKQQVDIRVMIPEEFLKSRAGAELVPVLLADYGNNFYNELLLLVRADSDISQVEKLPAKP